MATAEGVSIDFNSINFTVNGTPQPQGSIRAFMPKGAKHPVLTTDNVKLKPWRQEVSVMALLARGFGNRDPLKCAIYLRVKFIFAKPKSIKPSVTEKLTKPDVDKLLRGLFDALTGILFHDDSQVVWVDANKEFGLPERTEVEVLWRK